MPQDVPDTHKRSVEEEKYFGNMLTNSGVNLCYLGAFVLSIVNASCKSPSIDRPFYQTKSYECLLPQTRSDFGPNSSTSCRFGP